MVGAAMPNKFPELFLSVRYGVTRAASGSNPVVKIGVPPLPQP